MGGSVLFTSSGTWNPALYGLEVGKNINYIMIGGGGAGGTEIYYRKSLTPYYYPATSGGTNGGVTSIGSYISAAGGATINSLFNLDNSYYGGGGAGGWIPGVLKYVISTHKDPTSSSSSDSTSIESAFKDYFSDAKVFSDSRGSLIVRYSNTTGADMCFIPNQDSITSVGFNGADGGKQNGSVENDSIAGATKAPNDQGGYPGVGYGAGGGGGSNGRGTYGGNSGGFKQGNFMLTSITPISITVGAGGTPHSTNTSISTDQTTTAYLGGNGASGAVMLFWD